MGTHWGQKQIPHQVVTTTLWIQGWPSLPSLGIMQGIYNILLHLVDPRSKEKVAILGSWHDPWIHPPSIDRVSSRCILFTWVMPTILTFPMGRHIPQFKKWWKSYCGNGGWELGTSGLHHVVIIILANFLWKLMKNNFQITLVMQV
jgi:hypothetical protein